MGLKSERSSKCIDLDATWTSTEKKAQEAASNLKEAIQFVQEDPPGGPRRLQQASLVRRKALLDKLLRVSSCIEQFVGQFCSLREDVNSVHAKLRAAAGAHTQVLHEMEALSSGMEAAFNSLNEDQLPEGTPRCDDARVELAKLKQEKETLSRDIEAKAMALDLAERSKGCALEQVEKHKEVIAKTTADNMIFVMKLKQTEEQLHIAKLKQDELQSQLEIYRSSWFEEASAEIEDAVKGSLDKASACEFELQTVRKQQELRVREWERKLEELTQRLNEACVVRFTVEERLKGLEDERTRLNDEIMKQTFERQHVESEARTYASTVERNKQEMAKLKSQYARLVEETKEKSEDLNSRAEREQQLISSVESISSQLETQRAINSALMRKKEEVEWLCLEAQAEREKLKQQLRGLVGGRHVADFR